LTTHHSTSFVTTCPLQQSKSHDYLTENGDDAAIQIDTIHGMTHLHMLTMNPHAQADAIAALFNSNMKAVFCVDK